MTHPTPASLSTSSRRAALVVVLLAAFCVLFAVDTHGAQNRPLLRKMQPVTSYAPTCEEDAHFPPKPLLGGNACHRTKLSGCHGCHEAAISGDVLWCGGPIQPSGSGCRVADAGVCEQDRPCVRALRVLLVSRSGRVASEALHHVHFNFTVTPGVYEVQLLGTNLKLLTIEEIQAVIGERTVVEFVWPRTP